VNNRPKVLVLTTAEQLAQTAAERVNAIIGRAVAQRGVSSVVLAGGETPRRLYQILAVEPKSERIDWQSVHLFFGDERMVPPDDPASNYGMVHRELLSRVPVPVGHIHRIRGERPPVDAAVEYEAELAEFFGGMLPRFDLVILGVGEDGHTASVFPHTAAVSEQTRNVLGYFVPQLNSWRVTLTLPVLLNASNVLFLAAGKRKAPIVREILGARVPAPELPASLIRPVNGTMHWMLDAEAASLIPHASGES